MDTENIVTEETEELSENQKLDLNLFKVFEAVYTHRSLTKAAQSLHITTPAISAALNRIRKIIDDELFIKHGKEFIPTQIATDIIEPVRNSIRELQQLLARIEKFDPTKSRQRFIIAMSDLSALRLLPSLMQKLKLQGPNIRVNNKYVERQETIAGLNNGKLDFAIDPPVHADRSVMKEFLMSYRLVCAVKPGHPATRSNQFTLDDFLNLSHIIVASRTAGGIDIDKKLNQINQHRKIVIRSHAYGAIPAIVKNSDLAFSCPEDFARFHGLIPLEIPLDLERLELHLYWATHQSESDGNKWMRQLIIDSHKPLA